MPGVSVVYASDGADAPPDATWERALAETRCDAPSSQRTLFQIPRCRLGCSTYPGYPLASRETDRVFVCLEGRVYGAGAGTALDRLLVDAEAVDSGGPRPTSFARFSEWDGDYIALVHTKADQRLHIVTDPMGRLPLYATFDGKRLALSRDQRFLLELGGERTVDRLGIAQLLLLGFPIGRRTLIEGVERLQPGQAFVAAPAGVRGDRVPGVASNLEHKQRAAAPLRQNARDLADLFVDACSMRAEATGPALLALSGGLDSRAVGAALARAGVAFDAATFVDSSGVYEKEVEVARAVAALLGAPWRLFRMPSPEGDRLRRLLRMKHGLNTLAMAFSLDFFEMLKTAYGPAASFWSGDGGDKVLPDLRPRLAPRQQRDIAAYIIEKNHAWSLHQVTRLTGVPAGEVVESVRSVVESYPERAPEQKYVRFLLAERGYRWILEGEDTNRHHYWTVSPFDARAVVREAMACPDHQKSGHRLYRAFLTTLSPAAARIVDANIGVAPSATLYVWQRRARELSRRFPRLQRVLGRGPTASVIRPGQAQVRDFLLRQVERSEAVRACFSASELRDVASRPERWSPYALECLITATSVVEEIAERRSTLDEFADARFG